MDVALTNRDGAAEAYEDVKNLLHQLAQRFRRRGYQNIYGMDVDEILAEANYQFLQAYMRYDGSVKFSHWTSFRVWKCLVERVRTEARRNDRLPRKNLELNKLPRVSKAFEDLSEDADFIIRAILDTGDRLGQSIKFRSNKQEVVRSFLNNLGWTAKRIQESFTEIAEALRAN